MSEQEVKEKKSKVSVSGRQDEHGHMHIDVKFADGETQSFKLTKDHALYDHFAAAGVGKKIREQIATTVKMEDQKAEIENLFKAFHEGRWNASRNGEGTTASAGLLASALSALYGKTLEQSQEFVKGLSKKQQSDMRRVPEIAAEILKLNSKKLEKSDASSLLASFMGSEEEQTA